MRGQRSGAAQAWFGGDPLFDPLPTHGPHGDARHSSAELLAAPSGSPALDFAPGNCPGARIPSPGTPVRLSQRCGPLDDQPSASPQGNCPGGATVTPCPCQGFAACPPRAGTFDELGSMEWAGPGRLASSFTLLTRTAARPRALGCRAAWSPQPRTAADHRVWDHDH